MAALNFFMEKQKMSNWCWAAVSTSVFKYYQPEAPITQNKFAAGFLKNPNCNALDPACNKTASLSDALFKLAIFNGRVESHVGPQVVEAEIQKNNPVCCLMLHPEYSGHYIVVSAIFRNPNDPTQVTVRVEDPIDGSEQIIPYPVLVNGYKGSFWMKTFFTKPLPLV
jgi:hypothetical protein